MIAEADEVELLGAIEGRDAVALRTLLDRHAPWLTARLSRRCGDADLVDDALQDTFLEVWRRPDRYTGRGEVAAWLWGASATLASTVALAAAAALALPGPWWVAAAWLLPAFSLTLATLALGSYVPQAVAAVVVGLAWIVVVAPTPALAENRLAAFRLGGQAASVAVGLVAAIVLARRRDTFEQGGLDV